jgi:23S rRNA pseudouridine2605 synthase
MSQERLQKILARSGLGSRRYCEDLIKEGVVKVNDRVAMLGEKADLEIDRITVRNRPLPASEDKVYIMLHKPRGVVSSVVSQDDKPTVLDLVGFEGKIYPVGRLDVDSEGLILLTNDGDITHRLSHPSFGHEKEYLVLVDDYPNSSQIDKWRKGVELVTGEKTLSASVNVEDKTKNGTWLRIILVEGRKRIIRRTGKKLGLNVIRIQRTRLASLVLGNLPVGQWRKLTISETRELKRKTGLLKVD